MHIPLCKHCVSKRLRTLHTHNSAAILSACLRGKCDLCHCLFRNSVAESYKLTDNKGKSVLGSVTTATGNHFFFLFHFCILFVRWHIFLPTFIWQPTLSIHLCAYIRFYMRVMRYGHGDAASVLLVCLLSFHFWACLFSCLDGNADKFSLTIISIVHGAENSGGYCSNRRFTLMSYEQKCQRTIPLQNTMVSVLVFYINFYVLWIIMIEFLSCSFTRPLYPLLSIISLYSNSL